MSSQGSLRSEATTAAAQHLQQESKPVILVAGDGQGCRNSALGLEASTKGLTKSEILFCRKSAGTGRRGNSHYFSTQG